MFHLAALENTRSLARNWYWTLFIIYNPFFISKWQYIGKSRGFKVKIIINYGICWVLFSRRWCCLQKRPREEKMLVLVGYFLYLKVDQTKKNICHHNRRMFSIKGILVWSLLLYLDPPSLLSLTTGGIICVSLPFHYCDPPLTPKKMMGKKTFSGFFGSSLFMSKANDIIRSYSEHNVCSNSCKHFPGAQLCFINFSPNTPHPLHPRVNTQAPGVFSFLLHLEWDWCCVCFPHTLWLCAFSVFRGNSRPPLTRGKKGALPLQMYNVFVLMRWVTVLSV